MIDVTRWLHRLNSGPCPQIGKCFACLGYPHYARRRDTQALCEASRSSRARLRSTPQAYPESEPSLRTTRWQGMAMARLFAAHALATARTAFGDPMRRATWA